MNAPDDRALMNADCAQRSIEPVDASGMHLDSVRASSRPLGWKPLNIERRELEPGVDCLPGGVTEHLIFVSLGDGHVIRESGGDVAEKDLEAGLVSIHPSDTPVRWAWALAGQLATRAFSCGRSFALIPKYLLLRISNRMAPSSLSRQKVWALK